MNKEIIKEIIFCNKNGKPAAFVKTYGNRFVEIHINEAISLAKKVDFRILKNQEDVIKLQNEVSNYNKSKSKVAPAAVAVTMAGLLIATSGAFALKDVNGEEFETTQALTSTVAYASDNSETEEVTDNSEVAEDFDALLAASESNVQKEAVQMMSDYIDYFNIDFADTYKETVELRDKEGNLTGEEIEVKPALLWDYEVPALAIAYNDYTTRELQEIFNGTELDAYTLDANYKNGTLQLFGAYVISNRDCPVNLSRLIESPEGKAFVDKYENLFYNIKETKTEEEKIEAVNAFYSELYKDFPIDEYTREVGISHADDRSLILDQPYKLAITPMVTATEVMYQNLAIDHTLSDSAIEYFNDLGLCNLAYSSFEKAERATEDNQFDERFADYEKLSQLKIAELREKGYYVVDDIHRDLSLLTVFQENVNGHFDVIDGEWIYNGDSVILSVETETHKEIVDQWQEKHTKSWTEREETKTDDRDKAVDIAGEKKVKEAEDKVDKEIEKENEKERQEAEKKADEEQKKQQTEEDKHAEQVKEEVKQDEEDMQQKIDDANDKINNGETVNESDFGDHGVDFDDNHSDKDGNLDDSVENITTDGTGAHDANDPLPDPNETGKDFDKKHNTQSQPATAPKTVEQPKAQPKEESKPAEQPKEQPKEESKPAEQPKQEEKHEEPAAQESNDKPVAQVETSSSDDEAVYYDFDDIDYEEEFSTSKSDEQLVNDYVESLASNNTKSNAKTLSLG